MNDERDHDAHAGAIVLGDPSGGLRAIDADSRTMDAIAIEHAPIVPAKLIEHARAFARAARSERTRDAYRYQWARFEGWCEAHGLVPLPAAASAVALYLSAWAKDGAAIASLAQALAAISEAHAVAGYKAPRKAPELREVWKGIRRELGTAPRRVAPLVVDELRQLCAVLEPESRIGRRDRALLTMGFAAALRRSELVALELDDARFTNDGLELLIKKSKTDQEGAGALVGVPFGSDRATCPVRSLRAWLDDALIGEGAIFRSVTRHGRLGARLSDRAVARIVQRTALAAGLDPALYAGHSLRAGLATSAAKAGKRDRAIMKQGRWRSRAMVDRYVRDATLIDDDNAAAGIGL
jgi:integrase